MRSGVFGDILKLIKTVRLRASSLLSWSIIGLFFISTSHPLYLKSASLIHDTHRYFENRHVWRHIRLAGGPAM